MNNSPKKSADDAALRRRAEERLQRRRTEGGGPRTELETARFVHELEIHQIELEMQNKELQQAVETLRGSEDVYRRIIETTQEGFGEIDLTGRIISVNARLHQMFGYAPGEMIGLNIVEDLLFPEDRLKMRERLRERKRGQPDSYDQRFRKKTGEFVWLIVTGTPITNANGIVCGSFAMMTDITERKRTEEELKLFRYLLDQSNDFIFVVDPSTARFLDVNDTTCSSLGYTRAELLNMRVMDISAEVPEGFSWDTHVQESKAKGFSILEAKAKRKDGALFPVQVNVKYVAHGKTDYLVAVVRDVTEQKKLETQLFRAQRTEMIGTLAGGIVHDLNNILAPVAMSVNLLQEQVRDPSGQHLLANIKSSAERGSELVKQILTFARGLEGKRGVIQVKHIVQEVEKIIRQTFPKSIEIRRDLGKDLRPVVGDPTQLQQVLMNLCVNARDAMPKGGQLEIVVQNARLDKIQCALHRDARPGDYVLIAVKDTGIGISPENMGKIFDPFFTTKEESKDTGLGLATTMGIVKTHGGFIHVRSQSGAGTTFEVYLPAVAAQGAAEQAALAAELPAGHGELVLVAEDERTIREVIKATLKNHNYHVLAAADGSEAIAHFAQYGAEVRIVLTDMDMPVMNGAETIHVLRKIDPKIKIMAMSGDSSSERNAALPTEIQKAVHCFLRKPFTTEALLKGLQDALAGEGVRQKGCSLKAID